MSNRQDYEAQVRALVLLAEELRRSGVSVEAVARQLVNRRNALKVAARAFDDPLVIRVLERRNLLKYGNPIGPNADQLFVKYGGWEAVIAAAGRHATIGDA